MKKADSGIQLAVFDMEGCLTADPTVWEIMHGKNGTWDSHGEPYWKGFLAGELGYDEFARMDVAAWRGAPAGMLRDAAAEVRLMPGCRELLHELESNGVAVAIISNGLMCVAERFARISPGIALFANRALVKNGRLTGELRLDVRYDAKGEVLRHLMREHCADPRRVLAVGDGPADIPMFGLAGLSVAVCPTDDRVRRAATHVLEEPDLAGCAGIVLEGS